MKMKNKIIRTIFCISVGLFMLGCSGKDNSQDSTNIVTGENESVENIVVEDDIAGVESEAAAEDMEAAEKSSGEGQSEEVESLAAEDKSETAESPAAEGKSGAAESPAAEDKSESAESKADEGKSEAEESSATVDDATAEKTDLSGDNTNSKKTPPEGMSAREALIRGYVLEEEEPEEVREPGLLPEERESIALGKLSPEHIYYNEVVTADRGCADYIQELTIYDKEIDDTFVVHISLPPEYDESREYPLVIMTDGVWRLSDHPFLRPMMESGEVEGVILVSIGYPNDYDYRTIRERDLVKQPEDFLHFIVDNLIPYLSEIYSVSEENTTFTGHSYGGYFAYYVLFHNNTICRNTFENFYIGSPSMQANTGGKFLRQYESEYYEKNKSLEAKVYITVGSEEDHSFTDSIEQFKNRLEERNYEGLEITYEVIEGYNHDTVFKPSIQNTLKLFYGKE